MKQKRQNKALVQEQIGSSGAIHSAARLVKGNKRGKRGMLLLDTLLALTVGVFVILAAYSLTITTAASGNAAKQNNLAYNAARQAIENVRQYKGARITDNVYLDPTLFGPIPQLAELPGSSGTMTISTYRKPVKRVSVTISWQGRGAKSMLKQRTVVTLVAPKGITP